MFGLHTRPASSLFVNMLTMPPNGLVELVSQDIERWQGKRIAEHHHDTCTGNEVMRMRFLRRCLGGTKAAVTNPKFARALRALWSGSIRLRAKLHEAGYDLNPGCVWCSATRATFCHEIYDCPGVYSIGDRAASNYVSGASAARNDPCWDG